MAAPKIPRPSKHETNFEIVNAVARRSTCPRRQVGCVVVDENNHILGTGYNGVPKNAVHCIDIPCPGASDVSGDNRRCAAIHAEANCLMYLSDQWNARTMYATVTPCFECCKLICTTAIRRIIVMGTYTDRQGLKMLYEANVRVYLWKPAYPNELVEIRWDDDID